jgi:hypothetical protein
MGDKDMKTLSIIAIAGLAAAATANPALEWRGATPESTNLRGPIASGTFNVALDNAEHWDLQGSPNNQILLVDVNAALGGVVGAGATMTGIGWDVTTSTVGGSWLSEATFYFDDNIAPDLSGLFLTPGVGNDFGGTASFASGGIIDLSDNGIPDIALADGVLRIELYESFDDVADAIDSFNSGSLTIVADYTVPAPAGLAVLGLGGLVAARRRR